MEKIEVDNLIQLLPYIRFDTPDDFYFLQIIKRRKENPEMSVGTATVKTFYIISKEHLINKYEEVQNLCKFYNARAYIDLNRKSFKKVAFQALKKMADCLIEETYKSATSIYNSACGETSSNTEKFWIVDIDVKDEETINKIISEVNLCNSRFTGSIETNVIDIIPTLNGKHLLTVPFNMKQLEPFICIQPLDIHKSANTVLYYGIDE